MWLIVSGILGLSGVILGAYSEHGLKPRLDDALFHSFTTGLKYHQFYSLVLLVLALACLVPSLEYIKNYLTLFAGLFCLGVLLFCGSIYASILLGWTIKFLAPWGGVSLMLAWGMLIYTGFKV